MCAAHVAVSATATSAAAANEVAPPCGAMGVALQVLGSGGPEMRGRASSSYLVWVDGKARVLVDAGGGSALRFGASGAHMADLDLVAFTHLHSDHSVDFPALVKSSHFETSPRKRVLPVLGPTGTDLMPSATQFVAGLFGPKTGVYRYLGPQGNEQIYELKAQDLTLGEAEVRVVYERDGLRVSAAPVVHANIPALAVRVDVAGQSITFSGDGNGNNGNLEKLAAGSAMLVAHLAIDDSFHFGERRLHAPPALIGEIAARARVGSLLLSHRRPETLGKEERLQAVIATDYKGPIAYADDLSCFALR